MSNKCLILQKNDSLTSDSLKINSQNIVGEWGMGVVPRVGNINRYLIPYHDESVH